MKFKLLLIFFVNSLGSTAQTSKPPGKFSVLSGYGAAGSFFVRSYEENQSPFYSATFYKKKFIGTNLSLGMHLDIRKKSGLTLRYTRQEFSRWINFTNNNFFINTSIRHTNEIFEFLYDRNIQEQRKFLLKGAAGIYYLLPKQQEVLISQNSIEWSERNKKYNNLEELGLLSEFSWEYKFQPKVNLGIRTQFYFTVSTGSAESITLYPYIKISL